MHFALIYIAEAHAKDEWPISESSRDFDQHKTLQDRLDAARALLNDYELAPELAAGCYADPIDNPFESAYASWPFRFWVVSDEAVLLKPMPRDSAYDVGELEAWCEAR